MAKNTAKSMEAAVIRVLLLFLKRFLKASFKSVSNLFSFDLQS